MQNYSKSSQLGSATKPCIFTEHQPRFYKEQYRTTKNIQQMLSDPKLIAHHEAPSAPTPVIRDSIIPRDVSPIKTRNLESNVVFTPFKEEPRARTAQKRRLMD